MSKDIHYAFFRNVTRGKTALFRLVVRNNFAHFVRTAFVRRKLLPGKFWVFAPLLLQGAVGDKALEQILQGQGLPILKKVAQIQGGSGLALLNDAEVLNFVADIAADPSHQFDPSKLSHEKKSSICAALETLLRDNPTILLLLGVKETNVPFCDLRFSTFV